VVGVFEIRQRNFDLTDIPEDWSDLFSGSSFRGGGQDMRIRLSPGTVTTDFLVSFYEPYFMNYDIGFGFELFNSQADRFDYDERRQGGEIRFSRRFIDHSIGISFRTEDFELTDLDGDVSQTIRDLEGDNRVNTINPFWIYDTKDHPMFPTTGVRSNLQLEKAGTFLGGDFDYRKAKWNFDTFFPIWEQDRKSIHVLYFGYQAGWVEPVDDTGVVPVFDRFYAGGRGTVRGFEHRGIGPRENGDPVGGEAMMAATLEYSYPLYQNFLRGALFVDTAALVPEFGDLHEEDFRVGVGVGIRFQVPMLFGQVPVSLDFGWDIDKLEGDETEVFSFSMGEIF
jgi:outer membrane protein insertion porin family